MSVVPEECRKVRPIFSEQEFNMKYISYPEISSASFEDRLVRKREFVTNPSPSGCRQVDVFSLESPQQFLTSYMAPTTPYRSILLFHGTGAGKTCASIQIAETHFPVSSRRTLVLAPASVRQGFENNVYNPGSAKLGAVTEVSSKQCTGGTYYNRSYEDASTLEGLRKSSRTVVRRRYEFMGHDKFGNMVHGMIENIERNFVGVDRDIVSDEVASILRAEFDGRVIIVDEVHSLRSGDENNKKTSYQSLSRVLECARTWFWY